MKATKLQDCPEISGICEAFSMQPIRYYIGSAGIEKIELEQILFWEAGDQFSFNAYVGYGKDGKRLFQFRAEACNVFYK